MAENQTQAVSQEELIALVKTQGEKIAALELQLAAKRGDEVKQAAKEVKPVLPKEPVSHKGKKYQFILPAFRIADEVFTAEEASVDESILTKILAVKGQNIVKELV